MNSMNDDLNTRRMPARAVGRIACGLIAACILSPVTAQAQQAAQNISSGRTYYFEIGLLVVLFGGALFAVCRSSARN